MARAVLLLLVLLAGCSGPAAETGGPSNASPQPALPAAPPWTWKSHAADPTPRYEIAAVASQGRVVTVAGLTASAVATTVAESYDPATDAWGPLPPYPFPDHHLGAVALDDGTVLAFGGWIGIGQSASDLAFALAPGAPAWTPLPRMPHPRGAHAAVLHEGKVWLVGGSGVTGELLAEVDVYDPAAQSWSAGPPLPAPRDHLGAAVLDGTLWLAGGRELTLETTTSETLFLANGTWQRGPPMLEERGGFAFAAYEGRLVAAGGEVAGAARFLSSAEAFDPVTGLWTELPAMGAARTGNQGVSVGGRLYVVGGADASGQPFSDAPESLGPT